jgi:membrane protein DedA with SNARE-associated domain
MQDILDPLITALETGGVWVGPMLGVVVCLEAIVGIGVFVPATPLLILVGAAIGARLIHPGVLVWALAGAIFGTYFSYAGGRLARRRGFDPSRLPTGAAAAQTIVERYGPLAVVVSRFLGPPAIVPFLVGCAGLNRLPFSLASGLASALWIVTMAGLGAFLSVLPMR